MYLLQYDEDNLTIILNTADLNELFRQKREKKKIETASKQNKPSGMARIVLAIKSNP